MIEKQYYRENGIRFLGKKAGQGLLLCGMSLMVLGVASSPAFAERKCTEHDVPGLGKICTGAYNPDGDATGGDAWEKGYGPYDDDFLGGYAGGNGNAIGNKLYFYGDGGFTPATRAKDVYGGYAAGNGDARDNQVDMDSGGTRAGVTVDDIYGGWTKGGNAVNNMVSIHGGLVTKSAYGGWGGGDGEVRDNAVQIYDGEVMGDVFGGYSAGNGKVSGNYVYAGGDSRIIVDGSITGGYATGGDADENSVGFYDGHVGKNIYGGHSVKGGAHENHVIFGGGQVDGNIYGGYSEGGNATGNKVDVTGGHLDGNIYGGYTKGNGNATGNHITITGTPSFGPGSYLYGGWSEGGGDDYSGNTLEVDAENIHVKGAGNFQHWLFGISKYSVGKTMLQTDDPITMTKKGGHDADLGLKFRDGDRMNVGDKVGLMNKTDGGDFDINGKKFKEGDNDHLGVHQDAGLRGRDYDFHVTRDGGGDHKIDVTVDHVSDDYLNAKAESVMTPRGVALAVLNKGGDFVANEGVNAARVASGLNAGDLDDVQSGAFGAITGGHLNYHLDGHTVVNGLSLLGGYGVGIPLPQGQVLVGAFVEGGWSAYRGRSNQGVNSDGTSRYFGGGVLTRYELSGFYVEGSGRVGRSENHYDSDLTDSTGESARYKTDNTYYGLHAGIGYVVGLGSGVSLDPSTKYFWTHQTGSNVSILGDPVRFGATNSQRWRTGARINVAVAPGVVPYVGGYYEHEFDGKATATDYGFEIAVPGLKGDTGIAEVGVTFGAPADVFKVDLGVQGYAGKRSGVIGSLKGKWMF